MKHDGERHPQENADLYRAAMDHLRLPEDFESSTLALAQKQMEKEQEKQAARDVWRAKPFYRRPAAQVCFALLLILMIGVSPALLQQRNASVAPMAVAEYDGDEGASMYSNEEAKLFSGEEKTMDGYAKSDILQRDPAEVEGDSRSKATAMPQEESAEIEEQSEEQAQDASGAQPDSGAIPADAPIPESGAGLQASQGKDTSSAPDSQSTDGNPSMPGAVFRSAPSGMNDGPGVELLAAGGSSLYFQPYSSHENGGKLMAWDGKALINTGVSNVESIVADEGGYFYTIGNKLYQGASLVRDFSGEALAGAHPFILKVFGVDGAYLYLYANRSDYVWEGENPYSILRVSLDGKQEQILYAADGSSAGGKILQALLADGTVYFCMWEAEGGFYALDASGGQPRWLAANHTSDPVYLWNKELIFVDVQGNLCAVRTDGGTSRKVTQDRVLSQIVVRDGTVYYNLRAEQDGAPNGIYAFDLAKGTGQLILKNTGTESGSSNDFEQMLPAKDGLFLVKTFGQVFHYNLTTGELTEIA